jgi:hypothetical protein
MVENNTDHIGLIHIAAKPISHLTSATFSIDLIAVKRIQYCTQQLQCIITS